MYLARTIIFGGGPVVIPSLHSYVVDPGWDSSRDFLIELVIIRTFPGPNLNLTVFLGTLMVQHSGFPTIVGGILNGLAIFSPGIMLVLGVQGLRHILRKNGSVTEFSKGVSATDIGFIFTGVHRSWKKGDLTSFPKQCSESGEGVMVDPMQWLQ